MTYFINKILPVGISTIAGDSRIGKCFLTVQLANSVASGQKFLGYETEQANVIYYSLDNIPLEKFYGLIFPDTALPDNLYFYDELPDFDNGALQVIENHILEHNAKVAIIDSYRKLSNNQKSLAKRSYEEAKNIHVFKELAERLDISIILVIHLFNNSSDIGFIDLMELLGSDFNMMLLEMKDKSDLVNFISKGFNMVLERQKTNTFKKIGNTTDPMVQAIMKYMEIY